MSGLTTYGADELLAGTPVPATLWVQLHITDPGTDGLAGVAVEDTRKSVALEAGTDPATAVNDASADWSGLPANEQAAWFTMHDAEVADGAWFVGVISPPLDLTLGGTATIAAGRLVVTAGRHGV